MTWRVQAWRFNHRSSEKGTFMRCVFARLGSSSSVRMLSSIPRKSLRGVVFDIDGTLTVPNLDFKVMYARCGVPPAADIIEAVAAMPSAEKAAAESVIEELEEESRLSLIHI